MTAVREEAKGRVGPTRRRTTLSVAVVEPVKWRKNTIGSRRMTSLQRNRRKETRMIHVRVAKTVSRLLVADVLVLLDADGLESPVVVEKMRMLLVQPARVG